MNNETGFLYVWVYDGTSYQWVQSAGSPTGPTGPALPYKVYTALLTQSGINAPVAIVLENTIGIITWVYNGIGQYAAISSNLFLPNKTVLFIQGSNDGDISSIVALDKLYWVDQSTIHCITETQFGSFSNELLNNTSIEIRVYN
jgi:hypothetical protein